MQRMWVVATACYPILEIKGKRGGKAQNQKTQSMCLETNQDRIPNHGIIL